MNSPTSNIQQIFKTFQALQDEIKIEERRLKSIKDDGSIITQKTRGGIVDNLEELLEREQKQYEKIVGILEALHEPEQRQVLLARYIDRRNWQDVAAVLYGAAADYQTKAETYQRKVYRIHGIALVNANRILEYKDI